VLRPPHPGATLRAWPFPTRTWPKYGPRRTSSRLIGEHAALRHQGRRWVGSARSTPKDPLVQRQRREGSLLHRFGCQASGDAISFVAARPSTRLRRRRTTGWPTRSGVTIHEDDSGGPDRKRRAELFDAVEKAVVWYHERLVSAPDAGRARRLPAPRGYDGDVVRRFRPRLGPRRLECAQPWRSGSQNGCYRSPFWRFSERFGPGARSLRLVPGPGMIFPIPFGDAPCCRVQARIRCRPGRPNN